MSLGIEESPPAGLHKPFVMIYIFKYLLYCEYL
jgi:hypothetical protein